MKIEHHFFHFFHSAFALYLHFMMMWQELLPISVGCAYVSSAIQQQIKSIPLNASIFKKK